MFFSYGGDNNEGFPANPYNLRAEWGPSSYGDVRHRAVLGTGIPLPWKISASPFFTASSGTPYNITTGLPDPHGDGSAVQRPSVLNLTASSCTGPYLKYEPGYGCFNLNPARGTATIERNSGRGPAAVTLNFRISRTWGFGSLGESGPADKNSPPPGMAVYVEARAGRPSGWWAGRRRSARWPSSRWNLRFVDAQTIQPDADGYGDERTEPSEFRQSKWRLVLTIFANTQPPGRLRTRKGSTTTYNRKISLQMRLTF